MSHDLQSVASPETTKSTPKNNVKLQKTSIGATDDKGRFLLKKFIPNKARVANAADRVTIRC